MKTATNGTPVGFWKWTNPTQLDLKKNIKVSLLQKSAASAFARSIVNIF